MRVLHVMWRMSIGGAERAVYQLIREQRAHGVEADLVVATELGLYGERTRDIGAEVRVLACRNTLDFRRSGALEGIAAQYQIVHHHGIEPLLMAATARARTARLVYTHRGGMRNLGPRKRLRLSLARPYLRRFAALSGNTHQSARVLAQLLRVSEEDVTVVPNGLDFELLAPVRPRIEVLEEFPDSARDAFLVGTASNLQPSKRVDFLLEAIAAWPNSNVHCVILGDGPARASLEQTTRELGLMDRVSFLGRKEHIGDYLQLLDVFVLPSGPQEAFGNAAVEAMGVGIPTVVFADGGGLTEHVTDRSTGLVVRDSDRLAAALAELAGNETLRRELGAGGRRYVRSTYSLDAMFERYSRLYDGILAM